MKWEYKRPSRLQNGNVRLVMKLVANTGEEISQASFCYRLLPLKNFRELKDKLPDPITITGDFQGSLNTLEIVSGSDMLADVEGTALVGGRRMYAQAAAMIYGDSIGEDTLPVSNGEFPGWPDYMMMSTGYLYWPRVGETFTLVPKGPGAPISYKVYSDNGLVAGSYKGDGRATSFTPENDEELDSAKSSNLAKPIYFVAELADHSVYSYTMNIHRSR
ncbi:MAG: hypothetical protein LBE27_03410, partial [Deltaproteobacteria bacterium]|nr:hypothetical protein [Deltaproteobacteria bacterium]